MKFPQTNITKLSRKAVLTITKIIVMTLFFCIGVMKGIVNIISKDGNQTRANTPVNISEKSKISPKNTPRPIRNAFGFPDTIAGKVDKDKVE